MEKDQIIILEDRGLISIWDDAKDFLQNILLMILIKLMNLTLFFQQF